MAKRQKFKVIRTLERVDYLIPMSDDGVHSLLDGRTPQELADDWFVRYNINQSHATRDSHRVGNGRSVLMTVFIDEEDAFRKD